MEINGSASSIASTGIQQNFQRLNQDATIIANPNSDTNSTANSLINTKMTATDIEALVKVLKTEDQLIGNLLDIKA